METSKKVTLNNKEYEVTKIPMRSFGALAMSFDGLPNAIKGALSEDGEFTQEKLLEKAPLILFNLNDNIINFLSVASGIEADEIGEFGFDDGLALIETILEINNLEVIIKQLKNLKSLLPKM